MKYTPGASAHTSFAPGPQYANKQAARTVAGSFGKEPAWPVDYLTSSIRFLAILPFDFST
jgi:hypothetical protein